MSEEAADDAIDYARALYESREDAGTVLSRQEDTIVTLYSVLCKTEKQRCAFMAQAEAAEKERDEARVRELEATNKKSTEIYIDRLDSYDALRKEKEALEAKLTGLTAALLIAQHELTTLHNLDASDDPERGFLNSFTIDTGRATAAIEAAISGRTVSCCCGGQKALDEARAALAAKDADTADAMEKVIIP